MKFTLEIELGNDAMQDSTDVAAALPSIAWYLRAGDDAGLVRDANGNTVGRWSLDDDD